MWRVLKVVQAFSCVARHTHHCRTSETDRDAHADCITREESPPAFDIPGALALLRRPDGHAEVWVGEIFGRMHRRAGSSVSGSKSAAVQFGGPRSDAKVRGHRCGHVYVFVVFLDLIASVGSPANTRMFLYTLSGPRLQERTVVKISIRASILGGDFSYPAVHTCLEGCTTRH